MIIYVDENIPYHLANGLNLIQKRDFPDIQVVPVIEAFHKGIADEEWIPLAGQKDACVLTQDYNIHRIRSQRDLYMQHNLGVFFLRPSGKQGFPYWEQVQIIIKIWPFIAKTAMKKNKPFAFAFNSRARLEDISK